MNFLQSSNPAVSVDKEGNRVPESLAPCHEAYHHLFVRLAFSRAASSVFTFLFLPRKLTRRTPHESPKQQQGSALQACN